MIWVARKVQLSCFFWCCNPDATWLFTAVFWKWNTLDVTEENSIKYDANSKAPTWWGSIHDACHEFKSSLWVTCLLLFATLPEYCLFNRAHKPLCSILLTCILKGVSISAERREESALPLTFVISLRTSGPCSALFQVKSRLQCDVLFLVLIWFGVWVLLVWGLLFSFYYFHCLPCYLS